MTLIKLAPVLLLAACVQPLAEYTPVTDPSARNAGRFDADLAACRAIATQAQADYTRRMNDQMAGQMIAGILIGAAIGSTVNSDWAASGAAYGAAAGAASVDTEQAHGGPRRIIDRCMTSRGHVVLNDLGRG